MPSLLTSGAGLLLAAALAVLFQVHLKDPIWFGLGIGRSMQPLSDFPGYACRRIEHPDVRACEDMWLSEATRQLFLACSDPAARSQWLPNAGKFNVSGRSVKDAIVSLRIDEPADDGFELQVLKTTGYAGAAGDGLLSVAGFGGIDDPAAPGLVRLFIINTKPFADAATGAPAGDHHATGANTTIELFSVAAGSSELRHVRTYADELIATPNRVAPMSDGSFYFTNDHGLKKVGLEHHLSPLLGTGDVTLCNADPNAPCATVAEGLKYPNGLGHDAHAGGNRVYVPSSTRGTVTVYERSAADGSLRKVDEVRTGYAIDNVSVDAEGDLFVALFPRGTDVLRAFDDPWGVRAASAAMRITRDDKDDGGYRMEKILEDGRGEVLPASTTVVHDAKTGRLFFSSVASPWIAVCNPPEG